MYLSFVFYSFGLSFPNEPQIVITEPHFMSISALKYGRTITSSVDSITNNIEVIDAIDSVEAFSLELVHTTKHAISIEKDWLVFTHELGRGIFNKI